jgi:hypothetical protein
MMDHIFTLWAIIKEARQHSSKFFHYLVEFPKAFDLVLREAMF